MNIFSLPIIYLIVILPLFALAGFAIYKMYSKSNRFDLLGLAKMRNYRYSKLFSNLRLLSLALCLIFLLLSILKPAWGVGEGSATSKGVDVVFTLDVSQSMRATDVGDGAVDRLVLAKEMIGQFTTLHPENRYGLVIFAGEAFVSTPLTADIDAFLTFLDGVSYNDVGTQGTNINEALKASIDRFYSKADKDRGRSIVIISDGGEEMGGDIAGFAKLAKESNIKIFTIGIGSSDGVPIPTGTDVFGRVSYKQYQGETVMTKLNEKILKLIASDTNGEYYHAEKKNDLEKIIAKLKTLQTTLISTEGKFGKQTRFQWFLLPAFLFFLLYVFSESTHEYFYLLKKNLNKVMKMLKITAPLFLIFSLSACSNSDIAFRYYNSMGNKDYNNAYYKEAIKDYVKASDSSSKLKYISDNNLAVTEYVTSDYEKAQKNLELAITNYCGEKKEEYCALLFYNLGNVYYRLGEAKKDKEQADLWQKAIDSYKKDLEINASDKEAQENIDFINEEMKNKSEEKKSEQGDDKKGESDKSGGDQSQASSSPDQVGQEKKEDDGEQSKEAGKNGEGEKTKEGEETEGGKTSQEKSDPGNGEEGKEANGQSSQANAIDEQTNQQIEQYMKAMEDREKSNQDYFKQNPDASANLSENDFFNGDPFLNSFFGTGFNGQFENKQNTNERDW